MTTDLTLRNRSDPAQRQIDTDSHNPNNPKHLAVVLAIVPEDDSEDDPTEIAGRARDTGDNT